MEISDPKSIRALAHPLRLDLLQVLGSGGPATAAHCGRVLGASQASCSFHLRQLAKYGFVEDAGPGRDRRERQWRVTRQRLSVRSEARGNAVVRPQVGRLGGGGWRGAGRGRGGGSEPGGTGVVRRQMERLVVEREMQAILDYSQRPDGAS